jgi:glycosyltransferase involved in cell wall biosynthesis
MPKHDRIYVNGRFLSQAMTGVQRYAAEMIRALDALVAEGRAPTAIARAEWTLLVPEGTRSELSLQTIRTRAVRGSRNAQLWDQLHLGRAARDGILLSLANSGPVMHRRHLVVIHDAAVFRHAEFYSRAYATFHRTLGSLLARTARIGTVSPFSQRELAHFLTIDADGIGVYPNGADHLDRMVPDETVLDELGLRGRPFFLSLGSLTGNKNIRLAAEALSKLNRPEAVLVVVGGRNDAVFKSARIEGREGLLAAGRLSDERIAALYRHAAALVFPSLYEGFGIPPLEAMAFGCPVLASTAEAVRETCGDAASYFAPNDADGLADLMVARLQSGPLSQEQRERQRARAAQFTWRRSAQRLLNAVPSI